VDGRCVGDRRWKRQRDAECRADGEPHSSGMLLTEDVSHTGLLWVMTVWPDSANCRAPT